jgi:uncharacterized membrane protein YobD (UPF0266 family)
MEEDNQQLLEKSKEIGYVKLNFDNQLKVLEVEKRRLLKQITGKVDLDKINKIKKEINKKL